MEERWNRADLVELFKKYEGFTTVHFESLFTLDKGTRGLRCADMYPRIDILRISVILTNTDRIRIVISLFERIRIRIIRHGYSTDMHYGCILFHVFCFFNYHLITCFLFRPATPPVMMTYSYRLIRELDTAAFCHDILCSRLYNCRPTTSDAARHPSHLRRSQASQVDGIVTLGWRQANVPTGQLAGRLATASRHRGSTTSRRNWRLRLAT